MIRVSRFGRLAAVVGLLALLAMATAAPAGPTEIKTANINPPSQMPVPSPRAPQASVRAIHARLPYQ